MAKTAFRLLADQHDKFLASSDAGSGLAGDGRGLGRFPMTQAFLYTHQPNTNCVDFFKEFIVLMITDTRNRE